MHADLRSPTRTRGGGGSGDSQIDNPADAVQPRQPGLTARIARFAPSTGGPSEPDGDDPFVRCCAAALAAIGQEGDLGGMQVNCDMSHFRQAGIPTVVFGPGEPRDMHTVDESIALSELDRGVHGYVAMVREFLPRKVSHA